MSSFVISNNFLFLRAYSETLSLWPSNHLVYGLFKLGHVNDFFAPSGSQNSRLVDEVGKIGTTETGGSLSQYL